MGINSSTRRVTVVNDNQNGIIRISESVVQKLSQTQSQSQQQPIDSIKEASDESLRQQQSVPQQLQQQQQQSHPKTDITSNQLVIASQSSLTAREEHERELRRLEKSWKSQTQELQKQNRHLWRTANDKLSANISDVEKHLIQTKCQPICRQNEKQVVDCYHTNSSQPLKCSKEVKGFVNCVQEVRRSVLNRNG